MAKERVEIASLKDTLCTQQKLLQKLYHELEVERESSATAASEALSMILRLQGEKAAVKMEAEQYKRLVEEKMCHAEESLSIFEDLIYQKEMEIASLDYQVQAYRYQLLSMGCDDPGIGETKLPESLLQRDEIKFPENLLQRNETLIADISTQSLGRRNSAPPSALKNAYLKGIIERENTSSPERDLITKIMENEVSDQGSDSERKTDSSSVVGINSYWEQIKKLDGRIKEIAGVNSLHSRSETSSHSQMSHPSPGNSSDSTTNEKDQHKYSGASSKREMNNDSASSSGVLDVFEVPQVDESKDEGKPVLLDGDNLQRHNESAPLEAHKDETDWLKKLLITTRGKNMRRLNDNASNDYHLAILQATSEVAESQETLNQNNRMSEIVEVETRGSTGESGNREEELNLLNEIKEQLNAIECEIKSLKVIKASRRDKMATVSYMEVSLKEAMLHFWI